MFREIGSEFWNKCPVNRNQVYLLAGRTALEFIIRDIKQNYLISSVLLPSFCCHTMIEPFVRHGISIRFYDVYADISQGLTADVPELKENELFYYLEYFGFPQICGIDVNCLKCSGNVIIEDMTHSWPYKSDNPIGDYSYASYRKWTGFEAISLATKRNGFFSEVPHLTNEKYFFLRKKAFELKKRFVESGEGTKEEFLSLFAEAEEQLEMDYIDYLPKNDTVIDFLGWDRIEMAKQRRKNAKFVMDSVRKIPQVKLVFDVLPTEAVPLFVPVLIKEDRAGLRRFLSDNQVYCPIHWPVSEYHDGISEKAKELYQEELSLICDQRYDVDDMNRMIDLIKTYYAE